MRPDFLLLGAKRHTMSAVAVTRRDTNDALDRPETPTEASEPASNDARPGDDGADRALPGSASEDAPAATDERSPASASADTGDERPLDDLNEAFARAAVVVRARERAGVGDASSESDRDDRDGDDRDGEESSAPSDEAIPPDHRDDDDSVPVFEDSRPLRDAAGDGDGAVAPASDPGIATDSPLATPETVGASTPAPSDAPAAAQSTVPQRRRAPSPAPPRARTETASDAAAAPSVAPARRPRRPTNPPTPAERATEALAIHRRRRTPRYRSLLWRWLSSWFRRPEGAVFAPLPTVEAGQLSVSFAGHASALVRYHNLSIACDPMLGSWHKGIRRRQEPGLSPAEFADVDLILLSHADPAHMHRDTLAKLPRSATVVLPPRTAQFVSDLGFARVIELGIGQSLQLRRVDIRTVVARHAGEKDSKALSYVVRGDGPSLFFCGDSGYFSGFAEVGRRYQPDVALLPIGGYAPRSFRERHMSPLDALNAFEDLQARALVPIRFGAFPLSYEQLHDPARWLAELIRERDLDPFVAPLEPGASRIFTLPPTERERARRASSRD